MNTVYKPTFNDNCELKGMLVDGTMFHCIPQESRRNLDQKKIIKVGIFGPPGKENCNKIPILFS